MAEDEAAKIANVEVRELFPTPLWIVDLAPEQALALNAQLKAEIERMLSPRPRIPLGANWQTEQNLHLLPAFAGLVGLVQTAARGAMRWLGLEEHALTVTGCWANINPPGAHHPRHTHPNNLLSCTYYVQAGPPAAEIIFSDPRPQAHVLMPKPRQFTARTANAHGCEVRPGRLVVFPSWLHHHVVSNQSRTERISIAVNLMIPNYTETLAAPMWTGNVKTGG